MEYVLFVSFSFYRRSTWGLNKFYNFSKVIHAGSGSTRTNPGLSDFCTHTFNFYDVLSPNIPCTMPFSILLKLDFRDYPLRWFHHADKNLHLERLGEFVMVTHQNFLSWNTFFAILYIQTLFSLQSLAQVPSHPTSQSLDCPAQSSVVSHIPLKLMLCSAGIPFTWHYHIDCLAIYLIPMGLL